MEASENPVVEVVVGVVARADGRFLVRPREGDPAMAGLWELPGGKVAPGEDPAAALAREVAEETGLAVRVVGPPIVALCHAYPDRRIALAAYRCAPLGERPPPPRSRWVTPDEYRALPIPEANGAIVAAIEDAIVVAIEDSA